MSYLYFWYGFISTETDTLYLKLNSTSWWFLLYVTWYWHYNIFPNWDLLKWDSWYYIFSNNSRYFYYFEILFRLGNWCSIGKIDSRVK